MHLAGIAIEFASNWGYVIYGFGISDHGTTKNSMKKALKIMSPVLALVFVLWVLIFFPLVPMDSAAVIPDPTYRTTFVSLYEIYGQRYVDSIYGRGPMVGVTYKRNLATGFMSVILLCAILLTLVVFVMFIFKRK